ncbi:MAG: CHAT domain-containing protein, partial [Planctomycetia bacterium]
ARLNTYGDAQQRATFFAQFTTAFEQLVDGDLAVGDAAQAVVDASRGRSRTLFDQLQLAGVDPRDELTGPRGETLKAREAELQRIIVSVRAKAQLIPQDETAVETAAKLLEQLETAQREYADVWREILNASPIYRSLSATAAGDLLSILKTRIVGTDRALLIYFLGREHGFAFVLGTGGVVESFPLTVPVEVVRLLWKRQPASLNTAVLAKLPKDGAVPLDQATARLLIDDYRRRLRNPKFDGLRAVARVGDRQKPVKPEPAPAPVEADPVDAVGLDPVPIDAAGRVFFPDALRRLLGSLSPESLVVVPDGPLHKLPLEALVIEAESPPRYVLDLVPPLVYAPSTAALSVFAQRPPLSADAPRTLLTVADPAYPNSDAAPEPAPKQSLDDAAPIAGTRSSVPTAVLGLQGQLPRLPFTSGESERVRSRFDERSVAALSGVDATEGSVVAAMKGRRFLHLAAHGFADQRFGNLFGALALTPPKTLVPGDDGFLSLYEIYRLPLSDCELAVLSACDTNVGPQRPMEAGVTLASAFLTAGARNVLASHWSVDDHSTAELIGDFFAELDDAAKRGEPVRYAAALQKARRRVRDQTKWSAPFFWAPFVLIGPGEPRP